jgi:hypothetical protein
MGSTSETPHGDRCTRCLQPITRNARTCPNCGDRLPLAGGITVLLSTAGVLLIVFVVLVTLMAIRTSGQGGGATPADDGQQTQPSPPVNP